MSWYETIMEFLNDPAVHQQLTDTIILLMVLFGTLCVWQFFVIADLKKQIEERDNLIDYYYNEEDLKIK